MRIPFRTLRFQLLMIVILLVLMTASTVAWVIYSEFRRETRQNAFNLTSAVARNREEIMVRALQKQKELAETFLLRAELFCDRGGERTKPCLRRELESYISIQGAYAARLVYGQIGGISVGERQDLLDKEDLLREDVLAAFGFDDEWKPFYAIRAHSPRREISVVTLFYDFKELAEVFDNPAFLGRGFEVYLVGPQGFFFTEPLVKADFKPEELLRRSPIIDYCLRGHNGVEIGRDYRGKDAIQSFRFVEQVGGGCVVSSVPVSVAWTRLREITKTATLAALVFALLAAFIALAFSRRITQPIEQLSRRSQRMKEGDLDSPIPVGGPDEIKGFALTFSAMASELKKAMRDREEMVSIVSHDLKGPLSTIQIAEESAKKSLPELSNTESGRRVARHLELIRSAAFQMRRLISNLLDLSKTRAGIFAVQIREEDLSQLIHETVVTHLSIAERSGVRLKDFTEPCRANVDREKLFQVMANLIGNAIKFTPNGGEVDVELKSCGREVRIAVCDTGSGISPTDLPHIFQPYWNSPQGHEKGVGLGLYIAKSIIEAHHGRIEAESKPGQGSIFRIILPSASETESKAA